ncbi:electron transfer flavoprotein subunit alpha/FixB family protein [Zunongwangia sp.]|uniref:electron transfer flavoprotein subunit alpha/FixB family protein n=1 Tax=Zunongwangia sp. TaxID=1965325 RepID=UPI003AA9A648
MSVLVYIESEEGKFKKGALELASYAKGIADAANTELNAITFNAEDFSELGKYGISSVMAVSNEKLKNFNAVTYANAISQAAKNKNSDIVVVSQSANGKYVAPLLAAQLEAGYIPNAIALPESINPFQVKRTVFSNKAFSVTEVTTATKVVGLSKNAYGLKEANTKVTSETFEPALSENESDISVVSVDKAKDKVTIADAEIIVSGGRGLKGPENWEMIEEMADILGAATACSKPVSDMDWRPHSEHVGQTGKPVASNLYIAIGISGAIQHLAGVNAAKTKVVINNDPEAPFFKAADYGIVGDAFEVVPKLNEKLKEFKEKNA